MYIEDDDFENIINNSILTRCRGLYSEIEDLKRHQKNPSKKLILMIA